jgi:hypothetical protein
VDDFSGFVQIFSGFVQASRDRLSLAFSQQSEICRSAGLGEMP